MLYILSLMCRYMQHLVSLSSPPLVNSVEVPRRYDIRPSHSLLGIVIGSTGKSADYLREAIGLLVVITTPSLLGAE
jgi:hypothetical protein